MAEDDIEQLLNARAALVKKRLTWAQTIAAASDIPEDAIRGIYEVQRAIEVIELAIEEAELEEELDGIEGEDDE